MEDLLKASESSSNDSQIEIETRVEFENENYRVNDNIIDHDGIAKNGNQDSDIASGIDSNVDATESRNELQINNVQELMEGKGEGEVEGEKRGEEGEVKDINAGEQNENDENDSKDDDEEDDDDDDDDDDESGDDNENNNKDTSSVGKETERPITIEKDVSCRRIITALKVRKVIVFYFYSFCAILCSSFGIVLRGMFELNRLCIRFNKIYVC